MGLTVCTLPAHKGVVGAHPNPNCPWGPSPHAAWSSDSPAQCGVTWEIRWQVLPPPELKALLRKSLLPPKGPREQYCSMSKKKGSFVMR